MRYAGVQNHRKILCVFARYVPVFANFYHSYQFFPDTAAFMTPQGILTIAAYLPEEWEVRVVDENIRPAADADFAWADAVFVSGMHVQRKRMAWLAERAHAFGKIAAAGGPSVSSRPSYHPGYDILQVGELGDSTDELIRLLDASVERPAEQIVLTTQHRLPLNDFPIPAYDLVDLDKYMLLSIQWSSGCPYTCDFCDIPALYGHEPRMKTPERLLAELDAILAHNPLTAIFWVDDNLIGNKKAARELLPHIVDWQQRTGYRLRMSAQCTLNLAQDRDLLAMLRDAYFVGIYFGIESPSTATLKDIDKHQNNRMPVLEAARIFQEFGIEVQAGFIFGMDGDGPDTVDHVIQMVRDASIPLVLLNVLWALPKSPLWDKLEAEGRILPEDEVVDSNVVFKLPYDVVMNQWKKAVAVCYEPKAVFERYRDNVKHTYPNQMKPSLARFGFSWRLVRMGGYSLSMIFWRCGLRSNYKREFWRLAWELLRAGRVDYLILIASVSHHLIRFGEDVAAGKANASIYTPEPAAVQPSASGLVAIR
jgi:hopanoid C-2 methylase